MLIKGINWELNERSASRVKQEEHNPTNKRPKGWSTRNSKTNRPKSQHSIDRKARTMATIINAMARGLTSKAN